LLGRLQCPSTVDLAIEEADEVGELIGASSPGPNFVRILGIQLLVEVADQDRIDNAVGMTNRGQSAKIIHFYLWEYLLCVPLEFLDDRYADIVPGQGSHVESAGEANRIHRMERKEFVIGLE